VFPVNMKPTTQNPMVCLLMCVCMAMRVSEAGYVHKYKYVPVCLLSPGVWVSKLCSYVYVYVSGVSLYPQTPGDSLVRESN
jgi:hypothetical protein